MSISCAIYVGSAGALKYLFPAQGILHWFCFIGVIFESLEAKPFVFLGSLSELTDGDQAIAQNAWKTSSKVVDNHTSL